MTSSAAVRALILALLLVYSTGIAMAQTATSPADAISPDAPAFDGAPPPVPPAVDSRDERGRVTLRAVRLDAPLEIDGHLDEARTDRTV